jgi:drug/metabolite transporter (DMT)-like permease
MMFAMRLGRGQGGELGGSNWLGDGDRAGDAARFAEDRAQRLSRGRLFGFAVCGALWALSVIPLARDATDEREGLRVLGVYLVVAALSLGIAVAIRMIYALVFRRRQFWSPWLFLIAAVLAVGGYAVHSAGEETIPIASAADNSYTKPVP